MVDIARTGLSGLMASQRSLATTGHNIANVNNPAYSRQRVELSAAGPQYVVSGFIGRGVDIATISRVYDGFLTQQVRQHDANLNQSQTMNGLVEQLSGVLGDANTGLAPSLRQFFAAVQDVADDPASIPARQVMLSQGEALSARFQNTDRQLNELRENVNGNLRTTVGEINQLAHSIAEANRDIAAAQGKMGAPPNDLLDQRDRLLADLSQRVSLQTVVQTDGSLNVFIGNGQSLVVGTRTLPLETAPSATDPQDLVIRQQGQLVGTDLSAQLTGGRLGGYIDFRDKVLEPAHNNLGLLAVGLADTFNTQHQRGIDINGNLGRDFFQAGSPQLFANANNTGSGTANVTIADSSQLRSSDYEVRYDGANYSVQRLADKTVVATGVGPFTVDGLNINLSGTPAAGDRFLVQPTRLGAHGFAVVVTTSQEIAAAEPIRTAANSTNLGSAKISAGTVVDSTNPNLRQAVDIRFTTPTSFEVVEVATNTPLATGQPYTSADPVTVNGWEVHISGAPQVGDTFRVENNAGGVGDNRNALALAGLQSSRTLLGGTATYQDAHGQLVAEVAAQGSRAQSTLQSQQALLDQAKQARDAVSGVNLDEEAADLVRFQQAYEASAQVIRTADTLFSTLLDAVRR